MYDAAKVEISFRVRISILLFLIFLIFRFNLCAQTQNLRHYNEVDGLYIAGKSQIGFDRYNTMYIVSDRSSLWVYNGVEFKEVLVENNTSTNKYLVKDNLGDLWLMVENYLLDSISIIKLNPKCLNPEPLKYFTVKYNRSIKNTTIITSHDSSYLFFQDEQQLTIFALNSQPSKLISKKIQGLKKMSRLGNKLLLESNGMLELFYVGSKWGIYNRLRLKEASCICSNGEVVLLDDEDSIRLYDGEFKLIGVNKHFPELHKLLLESEDARIVNVKNNIYVYTGLETYLLNTETSELMKIGQNLGHNSSVFSDIAVDFEGNIWFAHKSGITKKPYVEILRLVPNFGNNDVEISAIAWLDKKNNELFLGSNKAYGIYDTKEHKLIFSHVFFNANEYAKYNVFKIRILDATNIHGDLYFVVKGMGLYILKKRAGIYTEEKLPIKNVDVKLMTSIVEVDSNTAMVGCGDELILFDIFLKKEIQRYNINAGGIRKIFKIDYTQFMVLQQKGAATFEVKSRKVVFFGIRHSFFSFTKIDNIQYLGGIGGLYRLKNHTPLPILNLGTTAVYGLNIDAKHRLWIGSNKEIFLYDFVRKKEMQIGNQNGTVGVEVNRSAFLMDMSLDKIFIGTDKGLNIINTNFETRSTLIPFFIRRIQINGRAVEEENIVLIRGSTLKINANCSSFSSSPNVKYCYKITGLNPTWIETNSADYLFTNLPTGKVEIQLVVLNGGVKISDIYVLNLRVKDFWYKETWFILVVFFISIFAIIAGFIYRIRLTESSLMAENYVKELKRQALESKLSALRTQINPHFVNNFMNRIRFFISSGNKELAMDMIAKYSHLTRYAFRTANKDFVELSQEIKFCEDFVSLEVKSGDVEVDIFVDEALLKEENVLLVPTMLFQPILENVFKYAFQDRKLRKKISLRFLASSDDILVFVSDNGKGFEYESLNRSQDSGLSVTRQRIDYYNSMDIGIFKFEVNSTMHSDSPGTTIVFSIPKLYIRNPN